MSNRAWVTLATNDSYGLGALVLAHSLRRVGSTYPAVVLITPSVTDAMRDRLRAVFTEVVTVDVLDSRDAAHLALLQRPELGITFTKIHCWNLTQYEKCVFLDADALVVQNCDELFEREELSAAPDVGWPDCFNSGVFVYTPSADTFNRLVQFAQERGSFDGGDQGLLNSFFSDWAYGNINKHLPFLYNVTSAAFYSYMPALKHYGQNLKIIHFIGAAKPWLQHFNWESRAVDAPEHLRQFLQLWWDLFVADVHAQLDVSMVEVEAPHDESTKELPPVLPPQDVSPHFHYQPILDPLSEFPWHRPDAHVEKDIQEQQIDMSEVFDPWDIYGGHILPNPEDLTCYHSGEKSDEQADLRKYVWEYYGQDHVLDKEPHENIESTDQIQQCDHRHGNTFQHTPMSVYIHNQTNNSQHHTLHEHQKLFHNYHQETSTQSSNHHEHLPDQNHYHQEYLYNIDLQQDSFQQETSRECTIYTEHYDNLDYYPNNYSNCQHIHGRYEHIDDFQIQSHVNAENSYDDYIDHSQTQHIFTKQYEPNHLRTEESQNNAEQTHAITKHQSCDFELNTLPINNINKQKNVEVYHVHVETDRINNVGNLKQSKGSDMQMSYEKANGEASNSEDDLEDIIPRHPYDGFYLRHRVTIDSRGRKICTHEIPLISSSSSSECSEAQEYFSAEETQSDFEYQSGVAGNLARVALGSSQREAIDELTRRQGWEAGNIDYMGVDSFDNIWAKISQTLSQARPSPPKQSPPRESALAQTAPELVEVQTGEIAKEPVTEPVEVAKEVVPSEEPVTVQDPGVTTAVVFTEPAAHTTQTTVEVEPATQSTIVTPIDTQLQTKTSTPTLGANVSAVVPSPASASDTPTERLPLTTVKPVSEFVIATEPAATTKEPTVVEDLVPAEKVSEQAIISKASATDKSPLTVTDAVTSELTSKTHNVNDAPAVIEAPASETLVLVETKEKSEDTSAEPIAEPLKVPSTGTESQSESVQEVVKEKAEVSVTETTPASEVAPATKTVPETKTVPTTETVVATETAPVKPVAVPVKVPSADTELTEVTEENKTQITETIPVMPVAATPKVDKPIQVAHAAPAETPVCPIKSTPEKSVSSDSATDSPPLANTQSKEEIPDVSAAKSAERRKPAGKLQLSPPVASDPLPTPDSELEDAAALAQSIIASELRTPTVTSPGSASSPTSPPAPKQHSRLLVDEPVMPTPPVGAVSLTQIGVKTKGKTTTAAQIESSVSEKPESANPTPTELTGQKTETLPAEVPKKKVVKKVVKKVSATGGDTPVPPPRKKEKKPKE